MIAQTSLSRVSIESRTIHRRLYERIWLCHCYC